jgi:uncharacterized protein YmfQ (DUF2313 family)
MRQRNTWTTAEDATVANRIRSAIANREPLRDVAYELANTLPHPATSILQRWYRVLSRDGERVQSRTDTRVGWNTRFPASVVALIRAWSDVMGIAQNDIVEVAVKENFRSVQPHLSEQIRQRQREIMEEMGR